MNREQMRERRAALVADVDELARKIATVEVRGSGAEQNDVLVAKFRRSAEALQREIEDIDGQLGEGRDSRATREAMLPATEPVAIGGSRGGNSNPSLVAGLRTIDRYAKRGVLRSDAADSLDVLVRKHDPKGGAARYLDAVGNDHYFSAFGKMLADPTTGHLRFSAEEVDAVRRVSAVQAEREERAVGTSAFALPFTLDPSVLKSSNGALNPIRERAHVVQIETHDYKALTSDGVTATYVPEATEATDASPTFVQPTIVSQQGRAFIPFSIEWGQDFAGAADALLELIRDGRDVLDAGKFLTGSGTNEPAGVLTGLTTTQRVQTAGVATYALADVYTLKQALPPRFQPNATWAANPNILDATYRFVGGNSTEPAIMPDRGGALLGKPADEVSTMVATTTTGSKIAIYGDFQTGYTIADRIGMSAEIIPHLFGATNRFPTGQRGLYAYWRTGAGVVVPNALRYLEVK